MIDITCHSVYWWTVMFKVNKEFEFEHLWCLTVYIYLVDWLIDWLFAWLSDWFIDWFSNVEMMINKGNNKITELRTVLQRES